MIVGTALIVLTWVLFVGMGLPVWLGVIFTVAGGILDFFALLFFVYLFNLDGKMLALLRPLFEKIYDKRKRNKTL